MRCPECGSDPRSGRPTTGDRGTDRARVCQGVAVRGLACAIDTVVLFALFVFVMIFVYIVLAGRGEFNVVEAGPPPAVWPYWLAFVAIAFVYFWLCEGLRGQTLGKSVCGLRVIDTDGRPTTLGAAFWRTLLRIVDWLPAFYLLGAVAIWARPRHQRVGDLVAGTVVTRTRVVAIGTPAAAGPGVIPWPGDVSPPPAAPAAAALAATASAAATPAGRTTDIGDH